MFSLTTHSPPDVINVCIDTSDVVWSSFKCSDKYRLVDYATTTVCANTGCPSDLCCEKDGKQRAERALHLNIAVFGHTLKYKYVD